MLITRFINLTVLLQLSKFPEVAKMISVFMYFLFMITHSAYEPLKMATKQQAQSKKY